MTALNPAARGRQSPTARRRYPRLVGHEVPAVGARYAGCDYEEYFDAKQGTVTASRGYGLRALMVCSPKATTEYMRCPWG